eukprot:4106572-Ditylum_brightwellii.AAC.2
MKKYARKIGTGKGACCFTGITDVIRDAAMMSTEHLHTAWHYLLLFGHNVVPKVIQDLYGSLWLTLLHKIWPVPKDKKPDNRPLGSGTPPRCVLAGFVCKEERPHFI